MARPRASVAGALVILSWVLAACGGGGGSTTSRPSTSSFTITTSSLPAATQGSPYATTLASSGGTGTVTWSLTQGSLPAGLSLAPDGGISGTPTQGGFLVEFTVQAQDSSTPPRTASRQLSINVNRPTALTITTDTIPNAWTDVVYAFGISAAGGSPPYSWTVSPDPFNGFTISSAGVIHGQSANAGGTSIEITVRDFSGATATKNFVFNVLTSFFIRDGLLPDGTEGQFYLTLLTADGGTPPYSFVLNAGQVPPGLTLRSTSSFADLSGTPTTMGSYTFTITGTDSTVPQQTDSATFTVVIATGQLRILTARLPGGYVGVNYDRLLESAGGEGAVSWSGTNLPPGLAVSSDGHMGGTPTAAGDFFITATVVDSGNPQQSASANYQVRIGDDLGRNDTIASATPLSNGDFTASLSPISDPPGGINPDVDVYAINMTGGATVTVNAFAQSLIDPVIEIVDASNARQSTCDSNNDGVFSESCMNDDDLISGTLDSRLVFRVPGSGVQTFYVRVVDWRGDARPELTYRINISGAN